jgi:hypothetical protein
MQENILRMKELLRKIWVIGAHVFEGFYLLYQKR